MASECPRCSSMDLQLAIDRAEPGATITLPAERIIGCFVLTRALTLRGNGAQQTILDAEGAGAVFRVDAAGDTVRFENMSIVGGSSPLGGGISIDSDSQVALVGCLLERNLALAGRGGAIAIHSGRLQLIECTLAANRAQEGGGLYAGEGVTLEAIASIFADNLASRGGAAAIYGAKHASFDTCRFDFNHAEIAGDHLDARGLCEGRTRIELGNTVMTATGALGTPLANHPTLPAAVSIENTTLERQQPRGTVTA